MEFLPTERWEIPPCFAVRPKSVCSKARACDSTPAREGHTPPHLRSLRSDARSLPLSGRQNIRKCFVSTRERLLFKLIVLAGMRVSEVFGLRRGRVIPSETLKTAMGSDNLMVRYMRPRLKIVRLGWVAIIALCVGPTYR